MEPAVPGGAPGLGRGSWQTNIPLRLPMAGKAPPRASAGSLVSFPTLAGVHSPAEPKAIRRPPAGAPGPKIVGANRAKFNRYIREAGRHANPITIRTLFHLAREHGWQGWIGAVQERRAKQIAENIKIGDDVIEP